MTAKNEFPAGALFIGMMGALLNFVMLLPLLPFSGLGFLGLVLSLRVPLAGVVLAVLGGIPAFLLAWGVGLPGGLIFLLPSGLTVVAACFVGRNAGLGDGGGLSGSRRRGKDPRPRRARPRTPRPSSTDRR